jgi:hypothetical protein
MKAKRKAMPGANGRGRAPIQYQSQQQQLNQKKRRENRPVQKNQPIYVEKEDTVGGKIGSWIGNAAQKIFKSITGFGDYTVTSNSLLGLDAASPPSFDTANGRTVRVKHREFIQDVSGSVAYVNQVVLPINPGLPNSFPWISNIASEFEEYRILGMVFEYKTTSAMSITSGTNTSMGVVMMATQYNANNPPFVDKVHLENYDYSTSCVPSISALHPIECAPNLTAQTELYVRNAGTSLVGQDLRLFDMGKFQLSTVGFQSANIVGELWVTYDIEFIKPKLSASTSLAIYEKSIVSAPSGSSPFGSSATNFQTYNVQYPASSPVGSTTIPPYWVSATTINLGILPIGSYSISYTVIGSAATCVAPSAVALSGANPGPQIYNNDTTNGFNAGNTAAAAVFTFTRVFSVPSVLSTGNILSITSDGTYPSSGYADIVIMGIPFTN